MAHNAQNVSKMFTKPYLKLLVKSSTHKGQVVASSLHFFPLGFHTQPHQDENVFVRRSLQKNVDSGVLRLTFQILISSFQCECHSATNVAHIKFCFQMVLHHCICTLLQIFTPYNLSSVQFSHSVVFDSPRPQESQHTKPPCPSPTPRVHPISVQLITNLFMVSTLNLVKVNLL